MIDVVLDYVELCFSIFLYVIAATFTCALLLNTHTPIQVLGTDKTFIESTGVQEYNEFQLKGSDLLLVLLNVDPMSPYPKAIKINDTPVIKITNDFIAYKMRNISDIYNKNGEYKLSEMLDYVVTSKEYVYSGDGAPYIHYTLEEGI